MKQQAIDIIRERIEWIERTNKILWWSDIWTSQIIVLEEIIEEIQALWDGWIPEKNSCNK